MSNNTIIALRQPETIDDPLTEVLRAGARELLAKAVAAEVEVFLAAHDETPQIGVRETCTKHCTSDVRSW